MFSRLLKLAPRLKPRPARAPGRRAVFEPLEPRALLSVGLAVDYAGDVLTVRGTDGPDQIVVSPDETDAPGARLSVTLNDQPPLLIDLRDYDASGGVAHVVIDGGAGDDLL